MSDTAKLHELLSRFETAMLITHSGTDGIHGRPMQIAKIEDDCRVWFFTSRETAKTHEIATDRRVLLVCQEDRSTYLSVEGSAALVADRGKVAELWREPFKVWFPEGKDDPDLVLIAVTPWRSEFWDNSGTNKAAYLWEATKAYLTGTTPEVKEGEQHGVLS